MLERLALIREAEDLAHNPPPRLEDAVRELRRQWKRVGPVPKAQSDYVWERFNQGCDQAMAAGVPTETE